MQTTALAGGGTPALKLIWPSLPGSNIVFGITFAAIGTQAQINRAIAKSHPFFSKQPRHTSGTLIVPPGYLPIQYPNGQIEVYLASVVFARLLCADLSIQTDATIWSLELLSELGGMLDGFSTPDLPQENLAQKNQ